jgi:hypothetical protein
MVNILKKPPSERSEDDLALLTLKTDSIGFFKEMYNIGEREKHKECCKRMQHSFFAKNKMVFL